MQLHVPSTVKIYRVKLRVIRTKSQYVCDMECFKVTRVKREWRKHVRGTYHFPNHKAPLRFRSRYNSPQPSRKIHHRSIECYERSLPFHNCCFDPHSNAVILQFLSDHSIELDPPFHFECRRHKPT